MRCLKGNFKYTRRYFLFFFYGKRRVSRGRLFVAKHFFLTGEIKTTKKKNIAEWNNKLKILCAVFFSD